MSMSIHCSICLDYFQEPVSTPCGHLACFHCFQAHVRSIPLSQALLTCPSCRATFPRVDATYGNGSLKTVRRIYLDTTDLQTQLAKMASLEQEVTRLERENARLAPSHAQDSALVADSDRDRLDTLLEMSRVWRQSHREEVEKLKKDIAAHREKEHLARHVFMVRNGILAIRKFFKNTLQNLQRACVVTFELTFCILFVALVSLAWRARNQPSLILTVLRILSRNYANPLLAVVIADILLQRKIFVDEEPVQLCTASAGCIQ